MCLAYSSACGEKATTLFVRDKYVTLPEKWLLAFYMSF